MGILYHPQAAHICLVSASAYDLSFLGSGHRSTSAFTVFLRNARLCDSEAQASCTKRTDPSIALLQCCSNCNRDKWKHTRASRQHNGMQTTRSPEMLIILVSLKV